MRNKSYDFYELPRITDLRELLYQQETQIPEQVAFIFSKKKSQIESRTYRELFRDIQALGTWQYLQGFQDCHVAVIGENSYEWLVTFFATVNGGNVAVPIDKELSKAEVKKLLQKADVEVVFCSDTYMDLLDGIEDVRTYNLREIDEWIEAGRKAVEGGEKAYRNHVIDVEKMCCILFTSGTSGSSKGVMLSQKNLAEEINHACGLFELEGDIVALLPFHHALGLVVGVFMVLHYGYTIYINKSLRTVKTALQKAKPQTLILVPLFVETFEKQIWETAKKEGKETLLQCMMKVSDVLLHMGIDVRKQCFGSVRAAFGGTLEYIICGGASLDTRYIKEFRSWGVEILNGYGTTECSPVVAANRNFHHKDGTVGLPIPTSEVRIADDGEVLVKGEHVMLGYYKDEAATAKVLKDGWYATGDLGYLDEDGFLTLTGRKKNLIILSNGENVSPEELEQDFRRDSAVREVLVYAQDGKIVAEIFPDESYMSNTAHFEELRKEVNQNRPVYKQVQAVKLRDNEFQKNSSKKILRYQKQE